LIETEPKEEEITESESSDDDFNDSQMRYRVHSKNRKNKLRNLRRSRSFLEASRSVVLPNENTEEKEDESETYVNKKSEISFNGKKQITDSVVEDAIVEPIIISETVVDDDSINEETLLSKKDFVNDSEFIVLPESNGLRNRKASKKSKKRKSKKSKSVINDKEVLSDDGDTSFITRQVDDLDLSEIKKVDAENEPSEKTEENAEKMNIIQIIIGYILYLIKLFKLFVQKLQNKEENSSEKPNFQLTKSEPSNFRLPEDEKENFSNAEDEKENFSFAAENKPNFRQRKSKKSRNRQAKQSESEGSGSEKDPLESEVIQKKKKNFIKNTY